MRGEKSKWEGYRRRRMKQKWSLYVEPDSKGVQIQSDQSAEKAPKTGMSRQWPHILLTKNRSSIGIRGKASILGKDSGIKRFRIAAVCSWNLSRMVKIEANSLVQTHTFHLISRITLITLCCSYC